MVVTDMGLLKGRLFRITARVVYTRQQTINPTMHDDRLFFVSKHKKKLEDDLVQSTKEWIRKGSRGKKALKLLSSLD
jgi:hypothetical protein